MATQKLVHKKIWAEDSDSSATADDTAATDVDRLDQSFIDELDNSMPEDISQDQLKA